MLLSALAAGLYVAFIGCTAAAAAWVRRGIPVRELALFALVPFALLLPDLLSSSTHLPTDHMQLDPSESASIPFRPHNPWLNDLATQNLPWTEKVCRALRSGQWPVRDRWNACGAPLLANNPAAAFSPATLVALLLPLTRAFGVAAAAKIFAALCGMWLWLRELRLSRGAALFGAAAFALSYSIVPWIFFPIAAAVALWPWFLFSVERLRDGEAPGRAFVLLTAVLAAWPLLGHIESMVSGMTLAGVFFVVRFAVGDLQDGPRLARRVALSGLIAAGCAAAALVPQALAILASNRRAIAEVPFYSPHFSWSPHGFIWRGLSSTVFPQAFGDGIQSPMIRSGISSFPEMALGYFGAAGLAAALLVLRPGSRRTRSTWALVSVALIGLGVGAGLWPFAEIAGHLPLYGWMFPPRILSWVALAGSGLAAFELDRFLRDSERAPWRCVAAAAVAASLIALLALDAYRRYGLAEAATAGVAGQRRAILLSLGALAGFTLCAAAALSRRPLARQALPYALCAALVAELTVQASRQYRLWPAARVFPPAPLAAFLSRQTGVFRVVGEGSTLFPAVNVFAGVEDVRTHDPVERRDYVDFLDGQCGYPPGDYFKKLVNLNAPALDFLNVRFLLSMDPRFHETNPLDVPAGKWRLAYSGPDGEAFENLHVLPRVFAPRTIAGVAGGPSGPAPDRFRSATRVFAAAYAELRGQSDWSQKAFVLGAPAGVHANGEAEIRDYAESLGRIRFGVRAKGGKGGTVLVVSVVQDGGWSARDASGGGLETALANGPFLAVSVPDGARDVVLDYAPPGAGAGLAVSLGTLLSAVAGIAARARRAATGV